MCLQSTHHQQRNTWECPTHNHSTNLVAKFDSLLSQLFNTWSLILILCECEFLTSNNTVGINAPYTGQSVFIIMSVQTFPSFLLDPKLTIDQENIRSSTNELTNDLKYHYSNHSMVEEHYFVTINKLIQKVLLLKINTVKSLCASKQQYHEK